MDTEEFMRHVLAIHLYLFMYLIIIMLPLNGIILLVFENKISK